MHISSIYDNGIYIISPHSTFKSMLILLFLEISCNLFGHKLRILFLGFYTYMNWNLWIFDLHETSFRKSRNRFWSFFRDPFFLTFWDSRFTTLYSLEIWLDWGVTNRNSLIVSVSGIESYLDNYPRDKTLWTCLVGCF